LSIMVNFNPALLIALFLLTPTGNTFTRNTTCEITVVNTSGVPVSIRAEIADTDELRLRGLMHRRRLGENDGMIFVFEQEQVLRFWMKNTSIPLTIAYIGKDEIIRDILDMKPFDTSVTYPSSRPVLYALEMNRGWFEKNNIRRGCRLVLNGCIGK
jgi:uncharacterized protein